MHTIIIDDDSLSIYISEQVLCLAGLAQVSTFLSADEALTFLTQNLPSNVPDIIMLDLNMPVMDGWDFLEALGPYEQQLLGRCHIYILTSSLDLADTERSQNYALVSGLLHKPLDLLVVRTVISQLKENSQRQD